MVLSSGLLFGNGRLVLPKFSFTAHELNWSELNWSPQTLVWTVPLEENVFKTKRSSLLQCL